jgi:hypothetical protein
MTFFAGGIPLASQNVAGKSEAVAVGDGDGDATGVGDVLGFAEALGYADALGFADALLALADGVGRFAEMTATGAGEPPPPLHAETISEAAITRLKASGECLDTAGSISATANQTSRPID